MKKTVFTLSLLFICSTAFSQNADIEQHLQSIESHLDSVRAILATPEAEPEPNLIGHFTALNGLWDSWNYEGDNFNLVKLQGFDDGGAIAGGKHVIISLSHRWKGKTRQQWRGMMNWMVREIQDFPPDSVYVLIQDEPLTRHHGFTTEEMNFLYDGFKERAPEFQFGFVHTVGEVNRGGLPRQDFTILGAYPFFHQEFHNNGVHDRQSFDNWIDNRIAQGRKEGSDTIFIIGQGFYNPDSAPDRRRKWRKPPVEAPLWYAEAAVRNNVAGMLWWVYSINRNDTVGLEDMPEYFERIKRLNTVN